MGEKRPAAKDGQRGRVSRHMSALGRAMHMVASYRKKRTVVHPPKNIGKGLQGKVDYLLRPAPFGLSIPWKRKKDAEEYGEMLMRTQNIEPPTIIRREITEEGLVYDEREVKDLATKA